MRHQPSNQLHQIMDHLVRCIHSRLLDMHHQLPQDTTNLVTNRHHHNLATNHHHHILVTNHHQHNQATSLLNQHNQVTNSQLPNQQHR